MKRIVVVVGAVFAVLGVIFARKLTGRWKGER